MATKLRTPARLDSLALHVASGRPATEWATEHGIALRTVYDWCARAEVKGRVDLIRGRLVDEGVGKLVGMLKKSTRELERLIESGSTDSVKLAAARGVIADMCTLSGLATLERRVEALERGRTHVVAERLDDPHSEA